MVAKPSFRNVSILLADSDPYLAKAITHCLKSMGFPNIMHVRTAADALEEINRGKVSFLITEWVLNDSSGIDLLRAVRRNAESPYRTLPIIMLTGKGELPDVREARDEGITEFVVKPFTVQTLFNRLEQLIDSPRHFLISESYVGPERRRKLGDPSEADERRASLKKHPQPEKAATAEVVTVLPPDHSLKKSMGLNQPVSKIITPEVLASAQRAIDDLANESLNWVREDIKHMELAFGQMKTATGEAPLEQLKESTLQIKSRAGTFGYRMASDVARLLYLFLTTDYLPDNPRHMIVVQKYIEVLKVIFAQHIKERTGIGVELYGELMRLTTIR